MLLRIGSNALGDAENARHKTTGKETTAPKCVGGNCEKCKLRHNVVGVENARHENSGKADYGKPLTANYRYFTAL